MERQWQLIMRLRERLINADAHGSGRAARYEAARALINADAHVRQWQLIMRLRER